MANRVDVDVEFKDGSDRFLAHRGGRVILAGGKGKMKVEPDTDDVALFFYRGQPGTKVKITLTPPDGYKLIIVGHPITDEVAKSRQASGGSRFFQVTAKEDDSE